VGIRTTDSRPCLISCRPCRLLWLFYRLCCPFWLGLLWLAFLEVALTLVVSAWAGWVVLVQVGVVAVGISVVVVAVAVVGSSYHPPSSP
jgi:hypothetical protein